MSRSTVILGIEESGEADVLHFVGDRDAEKRHLDHGRDEEEEPHARIPQGLDQLLSDKTDAASRFMARDPF